jgi:GTPase
MFLDEAEITFKAGHGGPGKVSFYPGFKSGPDGGNGGRGGDVYIQATTDIYALSKYPVPKTLSAENGGMGGDFMKFGRNGKDLVVYLPIGSILEDQETAEIIELTQKDQKVLVAKGGLGGRGNAEFKSSTNTTPEFAQPGLDGEKRRFKISLKLIADIGLIGLPNAGKSSLLKELTKATPKVADYPFTTLEPNLGSFYGKIIADIPGLIEGASDGKGLGLKFLKHIEKVRVLLHCIDVSSEDLLADYKTVLNELKKFNPQIAEKEQIILLTKSDLLTDQEIKTKAKKLPKKHQVFVISIHNWDQVESLKKLLSSIN